jgi:hypothetical protein
MLKSNALREQEITGGHLGVLSTKIQISSIKLQINFKFQCSMAKTFQDKALFGFSNSGHWELLDIWDLIFDISIHKVVL